VDNSRARPYILGWNGIENLMPIPPLQAENRGQSARTYTYISSFGRETYQILLQDEGKIWVARIVTLPNKLWANPNGREALKFIADTAEEAEIAALQAMEAECARTGRRLATNQSLAVASPFDFPEPAAAPVQPVPDASARQARRLLVRFGETSPEIPAVTANLSETGIFIISDRPARPGSRLHIDLRFPEGAVELSGDVVWTRDERADGRSVGFGVRLRDRPKAYLERIRRLT
jgi:hypothetical protein